MAEIVSAKGTGAKVERIIQGATKELVLISPYLRVDTIYMQELKQALDRKVVVKFICREDELKVKESEKLRALEGLQLFSLPRLHAKCYYNESLMVITSMNLHESSEVNNREIGVYLDRTVDAQLYDEAIKQTASIFGSATPFPIGERQLPPRSVQQATTAPRESRASGAVFMQGPAKGVLGRAFCIRCADGIPLDPAKPLCVECYDEWAQWKNPDYEEDFCHNCGKERLTSFAKPLCKSCYSKA